MHRLKSTLRGSCQINGYWLYKLTTRFVHDVFAFNNFSHVVDDSCRYGGSLKELSCMYFLSHCPFHVCVLKVLQLAVQHKWTICMLYMTSSGWNHNVISLQWAPCILCNTEFSLEDCILLFLRYYLFVTLMILLWSRDNTENFWRALLANFCNTTKLKICFCNTASDYTQNINYRAGNHKWW